MRVLGPTGLVAEGRAVALSDDKRSLLAALALHRGRPVTRDRLAGIVWGGDPPADAHRLLQQTIDRLRHVAGPTLVLTTGLGEVLGRSVELDAARFEATLDDAAAVRATGAADVVEALLGEALSGWCGEPFQDLPDGEVVLDARSRLLARRLDAEDDRAEALIQLGRGADARALLQRLVREVPGRERRRRLLDDLGSG